MENTKLHTSSATMIACTRGPGKNGPWERAGKNTTCATLATSFSEYTQEMTPSSPGNSGISSKILKLIPDTLAPALTKIINFSIHTSSIPEDWKSALVIPLFKNKGKTTDLNNYRGISIISPMAKIFEKVIAIQITRYFEKNILKKNTNMGLGKGIHVRQLSMNQ